MAWARKVRHMRFCAVGGLLVMSWCCLAVRRESGQRRGANWGSTSTSHNQANPSVVWQGGSTLDFVDLHIGTGGDGFGVGGSPPGAQLPFGMVRASPDTCDRWGDAPRWSHFGGYHFHDQYIDVFSHTHMVGPGVQDYGNIGFTVWQGSRPVDKRVVFEGGYRSRFSHDDEVASPGLYAVVLQDAGHARVEVVPCAGPQSVSYEISWPSVDIETNSQSTTRALLFDLASSLPQKSVIASTITVNIGADAVSIQGYAQMNGPLTGRNHKGGVRIFFAASIAVGAKGVAGFGVWCESAAANSTRSFHRSPSGTMIATANDTGVGAFVEVVTLSSEQSVRFGLALSMISVDQAVVNLRDQVGDRSHQECTEFARQEWKTALGRFSVTTTSDPQLWTPELVKFYTAAYHALMAPTTFTESNSRYLGFDGEVHSASDFAFMSDMSIWDIFRCQVPLLALMVPSRAIGVAKSLLVIKNQGGDIPRWPIATVYSGCMIGTHAGVILADIAVKGLLTADEISEAYQGARAAVTSQRQNAGRDGWQDYATLGFLPTDGYGDAASRTLAYAFDDSAIATLASLAGNHTDASFFKNRGQTAYKNVWNAGRQYFCPRYRNGSWACPLDPAYHGWIVKDDGYCEGDAAEWRWFVPHDLEGLIELFSSQENYVEQLDTFMNRTYKSNQTLLPNPYYWAGNEPDILVPWQFVAAGRPDLTQRHTRAVMNFAYSTAPNGMPGNDDFGALSSWYVWAALGLYPLAGSTTYILGSPVFPEVTMTLESGANLTITAHDASPTNVFVKSVNINGRPITTATIEHSDIAKGGRLEFWMQSSP